MADLKTVTIGGESVALPAEITLGPIKRFNEARKELGKVDLENADLVDLTILAVRVVGAVLVETRPDLSAEGIEKKLKSTEFAGMRSAMWEVLVLSDLYKRKAAGDGKPGEAPPPAKEKAGVAAK